MICKGQLPAAGCWGRGAELGHVRAAGEGAGSVPFRFMLYNFIYCFRVI